MTAQSSNRLAYAARTARLSAVLAPAVVMLGSVALINPGAQLERDLHTAAAAETRLLAEAAPGALPRPALASAHTAEYGSEAFWLTRPPVAENVAHVAWTAPVAPGDRVVVNFGPYDRQILDVVAVEPLEADATRIDTGPGKVPRLQITARKASNPDAGLVHFTVDAEGRGLTMVGPRDHAL